ncbi:MAG: sugar phosphate nucleotidyltransferase [archaeon]
MPKEKIAISISSDLLAAVDSVVETSRYPSRSQAMEALLRKAISPRIEEAVIMLSSAHVPLATKDVGKQCLLSQQLSLLARAGVKRAIIAVEKGSDTSPALEEISKGQDKHWPDCMVREIASKGTADAIRMVGDALEGPFLALSGDLSCEEDLAKLAANHLTSGRLATVGLSTSKQTERMGVAVVEGDMVVEFVEKPKAAGSLVVNSGIYAFSPEALPFFSGCRSLEREVLPRLAEVGQLHAYFLKHMPTHHG